MKISKLFHWLYSTVMLLPIFAIGVTCGYAMFNKNAFKSMNPIITDKYETNEVNSNNDLIVGNIYHFSRNISSLSSDYVLGRFGDIYNLTNNKDVNFVSLEYGQYFTISKQSTNAINIATYPTWSNVGNLYNIPDVLEFDVIFYTLHQNDSYEYYSKCENIPTEYIEENSLQNVFYYSVDKVTESPLFSWAYDSFLVAPFAYIVGLFSMPTNSPIVMLLSYWLAISIIWLVFDVVMYVPLLVHRWIDKGIIE